MASPSSDITFVVSGEAYTAPAMRGGSGEPRGQVTAAVRVASLRGAAEPVRVVASPGKDVVVLRIANGPTLVLHPERARDLLHAQAKGATRGATASGDAVPVLPQLGWPGLEAAATRDAGTGWMGQATLSALEVITGLAKDEAVTLATDAIARRLDDAVTEGVYKLTPNPFPKSLKTSSAHQPIKVPAAPDGGPLLVLIHGTFVDTVSTFGKLWNHGETVAGLFKHYKDQVYALDHPTLRKGPIGNALALAQALPTDARLHLVTHSRGGLVAEALARACAGAPLTEAELALLKTEQERKDLRALVKLAQERRLKVERMVRVACPSRGTLLASRRLDAYLSVLQWGLELAEVPVVPALVDFLHEIALRRTDPAELPGLEAMMPESGFVSWLNSRSEPIPGELRVVAGDMQGDSVMSWVKTLLSDAFFWTDNDLVVQTRSMYGGMPRDRGVSTLSASFLLDRGGKVSHFNYFANKSTVTAIADALTDDTPAGFGAIGPLSWAGKEAGGTRGVQAVLRSRGGPDADPADRPAVILLPGILGSNLKLDGKRIWLGFGFVNGLMKLAWTPETDQRIEPDGPIGSTYDNLIERLADTHHVIPFAFDWRRPIEQEALRLAVEVDAQLDARSASHKPVRLLAHSMGGLLARTMQLVAPQTWRRMMKHDDARLLMLGTPNGGSWSPMETLSGDDTFGNALVAFGSLFENGRARKMMAGLPGFIQLQAGLLDPVLGLYDAKRWQKLADDDVAALQARSIWHDPVFQRTVYEWGAPPQEVLDQAVALRRRLDEQLATLANDAPKISMVLGHSRFTPAGIVTGEDGLEYLNTPDDGDGRVTLQNALLPGVAAWKVDAAHGKLPDVAAAFPGYIELLTTGKTDKLEAYAPTVRGAPTGRANTAPPTALVRSRPSRTPHSSQPPSDPADVLAASSGSTRTAGGKTAPLDVTVLNGDLQFIAQPLLIGHYRSMRLTGAERAVDGLLGGAMSRALATGLYPDPLGTHQIFDNRRRNPKNAFEMARPGAVVVVGLGQEGELRMVDLVFTVRQAVLAYAQRRAEQVGRDSAPFDMAATLMGSGGARISAGTAAQAIVQGAVEANQRLLDNGMPRLGHITLIEVYLDRAGEAWRALQQQQLTARDRLRVLGRVEAGKGAMLRTLDAGYRGAGYDFISALSAQDADGKPCINYTLDTKRARTEVQAQRAQGNLLRQLVADASNDANGDPSIGRTLFNLLVPVEIEPFLGGSGDMVLEVDAKTATIPWELLDTRRPGKADGPGELAPWAIRCKLVRKLQLKANGRKPVDASRDDDVLVIGEPKCDPPYQRLAAARNEAVAVAQRLRDSIGPDRVLALVDQDDAKTIINALYARSWRAIHIAGHGAKHRDGTGVVLSGKDVYLGADEVRAMRITPELVFLNCCHLASRDPAVLLTPPVHDRVEFAANIAEELIRCGVRCVVAAGWAVEDVPAKEFADAFYAALLKGARFIDAVEAGRKAALMANRQGNTWAAYQCYGDPDWTWQRQSGDPQRPVDEEPQDDAADIASPVSLVLALDTIRTEIEYRHADCKKQARRIDRLALAFQAEWGGMGEVAEAFGSAYAAADEVEKAIAWYEKAVDAADGKASFKAAEQLANLIVRSAEDMPLPKDQRAAINKGIRQLKKLVELQRTPERLSLVGSAYKRLAVVEGEGAEAVKSALDHYTEAEALAGKLGDASIFYPAKNCVSCVWRAAFLDDQAPDAEDAHLKIVSEYVRKASAGTPDFWSVAGETELTILKALAQGKLADVAQEALANFRDLKGRVAAPWWWKSVYNEARFTMLPYAAMESVTEAEKEAAMGLVEGLKEMADS